MAVDNIKHLPEIQKTIDDLKIYQSNNDQQLTNQYGYIAFNKSKVDSTSRLSQYIRLALTTDAEKVVQFMHQGWCLPTPDLIISVMGGAKHFDMSPRLRNIFQMGLVDAAATTNAWIITTGTNAGVVQEVGEALNNYRYIGNKQGLDIPCIGIASWNYIADNSQLEITNPANSTRIQSYIVRKSPKGKCHLEPNHTHFLLFDDGKDNPSSVLGLRARIEMLSRDPSLAQRSHVHQVAYRSRTENGITSQDLITTQSTHMNIMQLPPVEPIWDTLIPIVMVLLEGGASSLNTVSKALKENTPIVVVKVFLCTLFIPLLPFGSVFLPYVRRSNTSSTTVQPSLSTNFDANTVSTELPNQPFQPRSVQWYQKIGYFYAAPIVRFYYNVIFFILFLGLFSYVYLVDYFPLNIYHETRSGYYNLLVPIPEIMLHICLWSVICEETYQVVHKTLKGNFITDLWNILAIIAIGLYIIGFITRFIVSEAIFTVSKIFMGLDLIVWYIRILHLFAAYERLGPKLEMIFKTIKDLLFFVCFIVIFLLGFSITSWSLINTTSQVNWTYTGDGQLAYVTTSSADNNLKSWQTLRDVINYGVWKIFGQVDPITDTNAYSNVAFVLAIIFVTIANVLLLSLLVALFNVTIQNVTQQSYVLWRYQRFLLVDEYKRRSLLPPPFNIFYYIVMVVRYAYLRISSYRKRHMKVSTHDTVPSIRIDADTDIDSQSEFEITDDMKCERAIVSHYWAKTFKSQKKDRNETKSIRIKVPTI
ncbi:unnamed protein product [Rotaria sordida]|uniref:Uncharacterized protein n=1 Tax=Rotaria sordida TaxID=392033 RepID=A0A814W9Y9_9BILA|nr:unnamed protein product [Rotaria sordida]